MKLNLFSRSVRKKAVLAANRKQSPPIIWFSYSAKPFRNIVLININLKKYNF